MNLQNLPKVELHRHLELSVRHSSLKELAPQVGIELPDEEAFKRHFLITDQMLDLESVLNRFLDTQKMWCSTELIERLTYEVIEDAYKDGIRVFEVRYAPTFIKMGHDHLSYDSIHEAVVKGVQSAEADFDIAVGLIATLQRILSVDTAASVIDFVIDHKEDFVGVDLADNEVGFDCRPFAKSFLRAKKEGLGITIHSGESNVPEAPQFIKNAIDYLGATRIGHGVQAIKDPEIMKYIKQKEVTLELCPTSNWLTLAVETTAAHPFRELMEYGIKTTINSDDPGTFNINLTHEYELLQNEHRFTLEEFEACNMYAAQASFLPSEKIQKYFPLLKK